MKKSFLLIGLIFILSQLYFVQNSAAQTWQSLSSGIGTGALDNSSLVQSLCANNDTLYAAGQFTIAGGNAANNIAAWNGANWTALGAGIGVGDETPAVFALTIYNGNLYAAGTFSHAGGNAVSNIAEWNGSSWLALGTGLGDTNSNVNALTVYDGKLYAAGTFAVAGGHAVNNIAAWDGSNWSALGAGLGPSDDLAQISALLVFNGSLYAGGAFDTAGNVLANNIAQWNGTTWSALGSGITSAGGIQAMVVYDSAVYAGGYFDTAGNTPVNNIAEWNGTSWSALALGIGYSEVGAEVDALTASDGILYASGGFQQAGNIVASSIAQWNGNTWSALSSGITLYDFAYALSIYNGNLYAGGYFNSAGGNTAYNIAEWAIPTGIEKVSKNGYVTVYPNPGKGLLNILLQTADGTQQLQIYSITGAMVYQSKITAPKTSLDLSKEAQGPYLYRLTSSTGELISSGKFIIQ